MFSTKKLFFKSTAPAYFRVGDTAGTSSFFVRIEDPQTIQQARNILAGLEPPMNVGGTIVKEPICWNRGNPLTGTEWSYHYDPSSVYLFEASMEVCDAAYWYVEDNLQDVGGEFLPGNRHCNWSSFLIEEVDGGCPFYPSPTHAYCCEIADSYDSMSNTRNVAVKFYSHFHFPQVTETYRVDIDVDYGDGKGWVGFNTLINPECTGIFGAVCSAEAPLLPGTGYQRYRVRWLDQGREPISPWSYTNPVMKFTSNLPTNNPIC
jgi:hypothetical protein